MIKLCTSLITVHLTHLAKPPGRQLAAAPGAAETNLRRVVDGREENKST